MTDMELIMQKVEPIKDRAIICLEAAADFLALSNQGYLETVEVYSDSQINLPLVRTRIIPGCFSSKKIVLKKGFYCTSEEQTLIDLLEHNREIDVQILLESLSKYYFMHGEGFGDLESMMSERQIGLLNEFKNDALEYYDD